DGRVPIMESFKELLNQSATLINPFANAQSGEDFRRQRLGAHLNRHRAPQGHF
ncbi:hypothetical protein VNI00_019482, partial [Paramarasmius palmivorus]